MRYSPSGTLAEGSYGLKALEHDEFIAPSLRLKKKKMSPGSLTKYVAGYLKELGDEEKSSIGIQERKRNIAFKSKHRSSFGENGSKHFCTTETFALEEKCPLPAVSDTADSCFFVEKYNFRSI